MSHLIPQSSEQPVPTHIAIIMDGNGRWAKARGLPREEGHRQGVENVEKIVETARELDIRYLTLYAFSVENWKRPKLEVEALMRLLDRFLKKQHKQLIEKEIRLNTVGRTEELPPKIAKRLMKTVEETRRFTKWNLNLALNYGARTEAIDAVKAYVKAVNEGIENPEKLDWERFSQYLYTHELPDPDLVIRTSGECRVSNFLLLQSAYAEYYFAEENWPEFGPDRFKNAIAEFSKRERRFGLTGDQLQSLKS